MSEQVFRNYDIAVVGTMPECDVCPKFGFSSKVAKYDAKTKFQGQPWAYQCEHCYGYFGFDRLGLGWGQRLVLDSEHEHTWANVNLVEFEAYGLSISEPTGFACVECGIHK